jgi:L-alanine-DL-glutamate epimerase-like enolase superfamily enzyme
MARVKKEVRVPIAADESVLDLDTTKRLIECDAIDVLVLKPMAVGGLYPARAIATMARDHGIDIVVTTMLETPIGRRGALHLAASLGPALYAHGLLTGCTPWSEPPMSKPPDLWSVRVRTGSSHRARRPADHGHAALACGAF